MKTGVLDSRLEFHELPFYEIQGLMQNIVETATKKSKKYQKIYSDYKKKITRFSPELEFCLHELGWMIYDPFLQGNDEVLFSNGSRCYLASKDYVLQKGFDRHRVNSDLGYPILTDEFVKYDPHLNISNIDEGIIDSKGYVDAGFTDSLDTLAEIEVMEETIRDKNMYLDYLRSKDTYNTKLEYITSKKNVISARKLEDGSITLQYVSENDGLVEDFINRAKQENKIAELIPITQEEERSIMKAA